MACRLLFTAVHERLTSKTHGAKLAAQTLGDEWREMIAWAVQNRAAGHVASDPRWTLEDLKQLIAACTERMNG